MFIIVPYAYGPCIKRINSSFSLFLGKILHYLFSHTYIIKGSDGVPDMADWVAHTIKNMVSGYFFVIYSYLTKAEADFNFS